MLSLKFEVYPFHPCIFLWRKENKFVILSLYVDDALVLGNHKQKIQEVKNKLNKEFKIKDLGEPKLFLGIEILRDRKNKTITLHQSAFTQRILKRFGMEGSNPAATPMRTQEGDKKSLENSVSKNGELLEEIPYREAIGSLLYLANGTRPDITYAVNRFSRKQTNYTKEDWIGVKRIFRYLKGTVNYGLKYTGEGEGLNCFADASLGMSDEEGKSTSGLLITMFGNDIITWRTKKQTHVALSSAEAEFVAMSLACKEVISIKEMCKRILKKDVMPILYEDNRAAIKKAKSEEAQAFKHIVKLCYHYIRLEVAKKNIILKWVNTNEQLADGFTKALGKQKFENFFKTLLCPVNL
jgi:hypothetical protein